MDEDLDRTPAPVDPNEIVGVTFYMQAHRAAVFQARAAEWLAGDLSAGTRSGQYVPPFNRSHGPRNAWELPEWGAPDQPAADWLVADLTERQRAAVRHMVAAGGDGVWTNELRDLAGYEPGERMNGVFRALAGRCRSCGRRPFWNGGAKDPAKGQKLAITAGVTLELFDQAVRRHAD